MLVSVTPAYAHIHPLVPADECSADSGSGAGNTAQPQNGDNGDPPAPGLLLGNVPAPIGKFENNAGVDDATDSCVNA